MDIWKEERETGKQKEERTFTVKQKYSGDWRTLQRPYILSWMECTHIYTHTAPIGTYRYTQTQKHRCKHILLHKEKYTKRKLYTQRNVDSPHRHRHTYRHMHTTCIHINTHTQLTAFSLIWKLIIFKIFICALFSLKIWAMT